MTEIKPYPRTMHLPHSPGMSSDDKRISDMSRLTCGAELLTTAKMDGGNFTMTRSRSFARSVDSGTHLWDTPAKALWAQVHFDIPEGWRVCGESMYARRSVAYEDLPSPFLVFGIWNEDDVLLSWDETAEWADLLGLHTVPVLYRGTSYEDAIAIWSTTHTQDESEGFVVRLAGRIPEPEWAVSAAKFVRADHVRTSAAWRHRDDFAVNTFASTSDAW